MESCFEKHCHCGWIFKKELTISLSSLVPLRRNLHAQTAGLLLAATQHFLVPRLRGFQMTSQRELSHMLPNPLVVWPGSRASPRFRGLRLCTSMYNHYFGFHSLFYLERQLPEQAVNVGTQLYEACSTWVIVTCTNSGLQHTLNRAYTFSVCTRMASNPTSRN